MLAREKDELHAQYAREIEAAQALLGQQESEMGSEHLRALQEAEARHQRGQHHGGPDMGDPPFTILYDIGVCNIGKTASLAVHS